LFLVFYFYALKIGNLKVSFILFLKCSGGAYSSIFNLFSDSQDSTFRDLNYKWILIQLIPKNCWTIEQLLVMFIGRFIVKTWVLQSSSYSKVVWVPLYNMFKPKYVWTYVLLCITLFKNEMQIIFNTDEYKYKTF